MNDDLNKLDNEIKSLNKLEIFKYRDTKLPLLKKIAYKMFGWYSDSIGEALWQSNQHLTVILDELASRVESQKIEIEELEKKISEYDKALNSISGVENLRKRVSDIEEREEWVRERFNGQDKRFESGEQFQDWARERFDGQDRRFESGEQFQDWARERFDGQDRRFESGEQFQDWARERFDGQDRRFKSGEQFQDWARERFDGQDRRFESSEQFQDWARERCDGLESRIYDIEQREIWVRNRFNESFDRLYRIDNIIDYSVDNKLLLIPSIIEGTIQINELMLNNKIFRICSNVNASDNITMFAQKNRIGCASLELMELFDKPGIFLDIGANIGMFSLSYASQGWVGCAFEAGERNAELLQKSINLNGYDVEVVSKAVSSTSGIIKFYENGPQGYVQNDIEDENYKSIDCVCLDDMTEFLTNKYPTINIIKIDIEGSEVAAIRGMKKMLETYDFPPVFMEFNVYSLSLQNETPISLFKEMKSMGYVALTFSNGQLRECDCTVFQDEYCIDRLFIHLSVIDNFAVLPCENKNREEILREIKEHLNKLLFEHDVMAANLDIASDSYVCYLLSQYSELCDEEILKMIKKVRIKYIDNKYIERITSWIK